MLDAETKNKLYQKIKKGLHEMYGEVPNIFVKQRLQEEWLWFKKANVLVTIALLNDIVDRFKLMHINYSPRYSCNASLILYLLGISRINPLPPHYNCPICHNVIWDKFSKCSLDLKKNKLCKFDESIMKIDGFDIPWQTWFLNEENTFNVSLKGKDFDELIRILKELEVEYIFGYEKYGGGKCRIIETKNIVFWFNLSDKLESLELKLGDFDLERSLIKTREYVQKVMPELKVEITSFADIIAFVGVLRSSYINNSKLVAQINILKVKPSEIIACREDLYKYYINNGSDESEAVKEMNNVRKGIHKYSILSIAQKNTIKDKWVISLCEDVLYLPSKTEIIEDIVFLPNEL